MKEIKLINANDIEYSGFDFASKEDIDNLPCVYDVMVEREAVTNVIEMLEREAYVLYREAASARISAESTGDGRFLIEAKQKEGFAGGLDKAIGLLEIMLEDEDRKG